MNQGGLLRTGMSVNLDDVLCELFYSWRSYHLILRRLELVYGIKRSMRWLKNQFKNLGLSRRCSHYTPEPIVKNCIKRELKTSNSLCGYRRLWKVLREKYGLTVKRNTVMKLLRELDPIEVNYRARHRLQRRTYISKGPNWSWHIDQYDKLSTFGFYIHGCVDGFSRKVMWLKLSTTNRDPAVILDYYLECVSNTKVCPKVIRVDRGSENVLISQCQIAFRLHGHDSVSGDKSVRIGSSPTNSRIESFWSRLRTLKLDWWITHLKDLQESGHFDPSNDRDRRCLHVVLLSLLKRELMEFTEYWNSHTIRSSRTAECPSGIPDDLYQMAEEFGGEECGCEVNANLWLYYSLNIKKAPPPFFQPHFYSACNDICRARYGLDLNNGITHSNCFTVYRYLQNNVT